MNGDGAAGKVWLNASRKLVERLCGAGLCAWTPEERIGANDAVLTIGKRPAGLFGQANAAKGAWIWNEHAEAVSALGRREIGRRLRREGFRTAWGSAESGDIPARDGERRGPKRGREREDGLARASRRFAVTVFGLEAVDMDPWPDESDAGRELRRRLARSSARALYALGLDIGTVGWEVDARGREGMINRITPDVKLGSAAAADRVAAAAAAFAADWRRETGAGARATLGADPEFVLLTPQGKLVPAARFFPPRGDVGCDSVVIGGVLRWPLAELRPAPSAEPRALAARLRRLLAEASRRTSGAALTFRAGALPVSGIPLGGHLHFSGVALTAERLRALDNAVALPLRLLEPPAAARRRPRYGALGDFRPKPYGGFEYRVPPSWLVSPLLARGTLALAKVAAECSRELAPHRPLDDDAMRDAFYGGDRALLLTGFERIRRAIAATSGYARYREDIDPLFRAIAEGKRWDESADLRVKWKIFT